MANKYEAYYLRRQFILTPDAIPGFSNWIQYEIAGHLLYVHPDLENFEISGKGRKMILLGSLYDHKEIFLDSKALAERLFSLPDFSEVIKGSSSFTGRYVILYQDDDNSLLVFNDVSGLRKVYYYFEKGRVYLASRPERIAQICGLDKIQDAEMEEWLKSPGYLRHEKANVIDNTLYQGVRQLPPNKYLDVNNQKLVRFWPLQPYRNISLQEGIELAAPMLQGFIKSGHFRHKLVTSVTAGNDSRLMLAASREICSDISYYVLELHNSNGKHPDVRVSGKIFKKINLPLEVITHPDDFDDDEFKEIYFKNNEMASEKILARIYYVYFKKYYGKVLLSTSFSDIVRRFFSTYHKDFTGEVLAKIWQYDDIQYVIQKYNIWLKDYHENVSWTGYPLLEMFNWEERNANWYGYFAQDKDMVGDEYSPYMSRKLMEIMLAVPAKYRDRYVNTYHRALIKHLWPELDKFPYNPGFKSLVKVTTKKVGVYELGRKFYKGW